MRGLAPAVAMLAALAAGSLVVAASPASADERVGSFTLDWENDVLGVGQTDRHYTNGLRLSWISPGEAGHGFPFNVLSRLAPNLDPTAKWRWGLAVGQSIYTPQDITRRDPDPRDRPYAGWLYGAVTLTSERKMEGTWNHVLDSFELDLGVVGPSSYAADVQTDVHDSLGFEHPQGWGHQLHDEPGVVLSYQRKWRTGLPVEDGFGWDAIPYLGLSLGNVFTHAAAGGMVRLGFNLPDDYGPPQVRPSTPGTDFVGRGDDLGFYLLLGAEGRAVGRNIFLDGNTFESSPHVDRNLAVGELRAGLVLVGGGFRLSYIQTYRTPEFHGQTGGDQYGVLTLTTSF